MDKQISYENALCIAENTVVLAIEDNVDVELKDFSIIEKSESTLDAWDYCFTLAIGLAGTFISTNEAFGKYLEEIHKVASGQGEDGDILQAFLGKSLYHKGDHIDAIKYPFKNRNGTNAQPLFHRLLWGHDILSLGEDNPFVLMFKQKGLSGILQAVQHLLADTASKQGLPMPGSSFFDFLNEDGKTSNYIIEISKSLSKEAFGNESLANAQELYSHIFTIRAQDIAAGTVVNLISDLYFKIRNIKDELRRTEIKLIAYTVNFLGEAVVGATRQNGVPYISLPLITAMASSFGKFIYIENKQIKMLFEETNRIINDTDELNDSYDNLSGLLIKYDSADDYINNFFIDEVEE